MYIGPGVFLSSSDLILSASLGPVAPASVPIPTPTFIGSYLGCMAAKVFNCVSWSLDREVLLLPSVTMFCSCQSSRLMFP